MTTATARQIRAIQALADIIEDTAKEAGPLGAPSGVIYAALMGAGVTLDVYTALLASMVKAGRITIAFDCIHAVPR